MSKFENFITSLSDHELAIFVRFSYHGFLKKTKERIDKEIKKRKLSPEKLEKYSKEKLNKTFTDELNKCIRCGSTKRITETNFWELPFNEFSSVEMAIDTNRCQLCGFNQEKSLSRDFFERINRKWKSIIKSRFSKWNSL